MSSSETCPSCGPQCGGHGLLTHGEREAWLGITGWHGLTWQRVVVVGETPKRYRIRALAPTRLAGRRRELQPGSSTALVPRGAIRFGTRPVDR